MSKRMGMGIPNNHSNPARAISASYVSDCVATGETRPSSRQDQHRLAGGRDDGALRRGGPGMGGGGRFRQCEEQPAGADGAGRVAVAPTWLPDQGAVVCPNSEPSTVRISYTPLACRVPWTTPA